MSSVTIANEETVSSTHYAVPADGTRIPAHLKTSQAAMVAARSPVAGSWSCPARPT